MNDDQDWIEHCLCSAASAHPLIGHGVIQQMKALVSRKLIEKPYRSAALSDTAKKLLNVLDSDVQPPAVSQ